MPRVHALFAASALLASTALAQLPCFNLNLGTDLALTDDSVSATLPLGFTFTYGGVPYTTISVCSNGFIWLGAAPATNATDWSPTLAELQSGPARICPLWMDFNPAAVGSGHVYYDNSTSGVARVTWSNVFTFNTTIMGSMQVTLDATNSVTITYGTLGPSSTAQGGTTIIGATTGTPAVVGTNSLATRPAVIVTDAWADVLATPTGTPAPYGGTKMLWSPTAPGFVVSDITCTPNTLPPPPPPASVAVLGTGCPPNSGQPSLYEVFSTTNAPDLSGLDLSFVPAGVTDYLALQGVSPTWFSGFTNNLSLSDDISVAATLPFSFPYRGGLETQIFISSNGFITLGATNPGSGCCTGTAATMLAGPPRISGFWADLYPPGATAGGGVFADLDAVSGDFVITWNAVPEYFSNPPETFQIALSPTGMFTIRWLTTVNASHTWIAGYSHGSGTTDPGATDLSAANGNLVGGQIQFPLVLAAAPGSLPRVNTTFTMNVSGISPSPQGNVVFLFIGFTELNPGVDLGPILGATNCTAFMLPGPSDLNFLNLTLGAPTTSFSIPIPNDPNLYGGVGIGQAVSDDTTANVFGWKISNGLRITVGV